MVRFCSWCGQTGVCHQRLCALPRDAGLVAGCTCHPEKCVKCQGFLDPERKKRAAWFVDIVPLLHRVNTLLKTPLENTDRAFLEGFVARLAAGHLEQYTDRARIRELEAEYLGRPLPLHLVPDPEDT